MKKSQHTIDFLFPLAVFFVFSAAAVVVLLLSANIYKGIVNSSEETFETTTVLSYMNEKIRQSDENGAEAIYLDEFDGCQALAIARQFGDKTYITYIYEFDGELKETFVQEGIAASAKAGTTILEVNNFSMTQVSADLFQFACEDREGNPHSILVSIQSEAE